MSPRPSASAMLPGLDPNMCLCHSGVVQLFNAVRKHQKTLDQQVKEAGSSERKKAKILSSFSKKDFIGALRRTEEGGRVHGEGRTHGKAEEGAVSPSVCSYPVFIITLWRCGLLILSSVSLLFTCCCLAHFSIFDPSHC